MPSPPASTNQPAQTFEADGTRPDSTAGKEPSNSFKTDSTGGSSQHTQPQDDGAGVARQWKAPSRNPMSLQEAERILGMRCGDYWKKHSDFKFQVMETPAGRRYGLFREVDNKFELDPCVAWQESWDDVIEELWNEQYDFWSSQMRPGRGRNEMLAKIVYAVRYVQVLRDQESVEKNGRQG